MAKEKLRIEVDSMGEMSVPTTAYWGPQTQRAIENFPVSGERIPRTMIRALGLLKGAAAHVNAEDGRLSDKVGDAIVLASRAVCGGELDEQFPVDIFQTGSGTSTNMNANEVIASRANEFLGGKRGDKSPVHPNDHVNMGQSSNDVIPSAIHIAAYETVEHQLLPALEELHLVLSQRASDFDGILKIGRTHLQDATPIRLGQEFSGYAAQVSQGKARVARAQVGLAELALGGTAVGTGLNVAPGFAKAVIAQVAATTGLPFVEADNHFEAQAARDAAVEMSGALRTLAVSLYKIANDLRFLGSGPRCGIGELRLPALQPGSSIMPGKVNPVIPEVVMQVAAQVIGNDAAIGVGGLSGNFELNVMMPLIARNLLSSITLLSRSCELFARRCVTGLEADADRCREMVESSLAMCTSLAPVIGYEAAAEIAHEAYISGRTVREVAASRAILPIDELMRLLDPEGMT
jgi:fumarate hydratase, class II